MIDKKISVIGSGWVGTAIGRGFAGMDYEVIFYDVVDKDLPNFTKDINYAIENSDICESDNRFCFGKGRPKGRYRAVFMGDSEKGERVR